VLRKQTAMQSKSLRTCPSKPVGLYAAIEWGLRDIKFLSPFSFSGTKNGSEHTFYCIMKDYDKEFNVYIPSFTEQFICITLPNKSGDNSILLSNKDCEHVMGKKVSMLWLSEKLKKKWAMKISPISTV